MTDAKNAGAAGLSVGWATADITPHGPVLLYGQYYDRPSQYVQSNLTVTACAIESTGEAGGPEQAILVSMDLICSYTVLQEAVRQAVQPLLPDFDVRKLFLQATHTHSAPQPTATGDYGALLVGQISKAVVLAWQHRQPAGVSHGLAYAVVGHNRRVQYADGTAEMYGRVDRNDFAGLEGPTDAGVSMLFCWDRQNELTGVIMNVPCPAQVTEAKYFVSSDYWGEVRKGLSEQFSRPVYVLAQCGASGDLSPRDLPRGYRAGEPNMWDVPGTLEIGKRLVHAFNAVYPPARERIERRVVFQHVVEDIRVPTRVIPEAEYADALRVSTQIHSREPADKTSPDTAWNRFLAEIRENEQRREHGPWDNKNTDYGIVRKRDALIDLYRNQPNRPFYDMELHVLRIGDVAVASNPFELFVDYGLAIMAKSPAPLTLVVQLSCDYGDYLPTEKAIRGGGYSAIATPVGPEGGWHLVSKTVAVINRLWADESTL